MLYTLRNGIGADEKFVKQKVYFINMKTLLLRLSDVPRPPYLFAVQVV